MKISAMPRWARALLKISAGAIVLVVLLWLGIAAYVSTHKAVLLKQLTDQLNENITGTLKIRDIEPTMVRGFPGIGIALKDVVLRDSLWATHRHDLLNVKYIYVSVNAFSLLRGQPRIREISITDGSLYLYTDSSGYTNTNLFYKRTESGKEKGKPRINHIYLQKVALVLEDKAKRKLFRFGIKRMSLNVDYDGAGWKAKIGVQAHVDDLVFNTNKGSFLKGQDLTANLTAGYDRLTEIVTIPLQQIKVNDDRLKISGSFYTRDKPVSFVLNIASDGILFRRGLALVTPATAARLGVIDFATPIAVNVAIKARMLYRDTPVVTIRFSTAGNTLHIPGGEISDCAFSGSFTNQADTAKGKNDPNSLIALYRLSGKYSGIPFSADTIALTNLSRPILAGHFVAGFGVDKLNDMIGSDNFDFKKGTIAINLLYKGGVYNNDTTPRYIRGIIKVQDAAVTYTPRALAVSNSNFTLRFDGNDLYVEDVRLQTGNNVMQMQGYLKNFASLYYTDPEKILLDWKIKSSQLNLEDFIAFLPKRKAVAATAATTAKNAGKIGRMSHQLDKMLAMGSVHMSLNVDKAVYRRFIASNIAADVSLSESGIMIKNAAISNAGGRLLLNVAVDQRSAVNTFSLAANVSAVNVKEFFYECGNFGQHAITDSNIRGTLSATTNIAGGITDNGKIVPGSLNGYVDVKLDNAALINYAPLLKIGRYVFRNRELNNVIFSNIANRLVIKGEQITIAPMHIESTAITMNVGGIYSMGKGTDISIDIPLRNPKKDRGITDDSIRAENSTRGLVVHLQASDGSDGNVQIKLKMHSAAADADGEKKKGRRGRKKGK